jgi:hypothetical protein
MFTYNTTIKKPSAGALHLMTCRTCIWRDGDACSLTSRRYAEHAFEGNCPIQKFKQVQNFRRPARPLVMLSARRLSPKVRGF